MRFVNKIGEWKGNTQRAVWINLNQLQLNYVYNNSTYPSDFSIRTNSIKTFSGPIISISVPKSVKRCSARSWANFIYAGITNRSSKARDPPSMRTHFAAVSMGYPSYARNRACALPSPSPFHYVMAKIVPVVQLAAHAKSGTLYGLTVVQPNFFGLMGYYYYYYFVQLWGYAGASLLNQIKVFLCYFNDKKMLVF